MIMIDLFNNKIEKKINIIIFSLLQQYTKELTILYFSFYNWREISKMKIKTDELLNELGFFQIII